MGAQNGNGNGNGKNGDPHEILPLDLVEEALELQDFEESRVTNPPPPFTLDTIQDWRERTETEGVSIDTLHEGISAVAALSEVLVENSTEIASELRATAVAVEQISIQTQTIAAKVESTSQHTHAVDDDVSKVNKTLRALRKDVQFMKDDLRDVKESVLVLPAIKSMLGEILTRLPDPPKPDSGK